MNVKVLFKYDASRDLTMITVEKRGFVVDQISMNGKMNSYSKKIIRKDLTEQHEDDFINENEYDYEYAY